MVCAKSASSTMLEVSMGTQSAMRGHPGVAGRAVELLDEGALADLPRQSVLPPAVAHDQDLHQGPIFSYPTGVLPRLIPLTPVVDLTARRGAFRVRSRLRDAAAIRLRGRRLLAPAREPSRDPPRGTGCSRCRRARRRRTFGVDFTTIGPGSVWMEAAAGRGRRRSTRGPTPTTCSIPCSASSSCCAGTGRVVENRFVAGKVADPEVLRSYYHRVHAGHGYTPSEPFLFELHAAMLRRLERLFLAHIAPGARVLDAGCGRSLFTEIRPRLAVHHRRRRRRPRPAAVAQGGASRGALGGRRRRTRCRSATGAFDALFAGELIEHLADPAAGRGRVPARAAPGGTLILTTPNRLRLANLVDRSERPYSPDHLSELSYDEVRALLDGEGFEVAGVDRRPPRADAQLALAACPSSTACSAAGTARGRCR